VVLFSFGFVLVFLAMIALYASLTPRKTWRGQNAFGDIYVTNPPTGKKQNDILLTTGLNVSFTR